MPFPLALLLAAFTPLQPSDPPAVPVPTTTAAAPAPIIDAKAKALLEANEKAMFALSAYRADCYTTLIFPISTRRPKGGEEYEMATLTAVKPNLMRYDGWEMTKTATGDWKKQKENPTYTFAVDGKTSVHQFGNNYRVGTEVKPAYLATISEPWSGFYSAKNSKSAEMVTDNKGLKELRYVGKETVDGTSCDVIAFKYHADYEEGQDYDGKLYLGPDHLVRREIETIQFGGKPGYTRDAVLRNIKTNFALPPMSTYAYVPPPGAKKEDEAELARQRAEAEAKRPKLLANGTQAPDFTVEDLNGKPVKLSDFRGKTVILDFWATWCGPCMSAMPHTNAAGQKFKDNNVVVVAVNVWDTKDAYKAWVPEHQAKYDAVTFLLDPHGRVGDVAKTLYNVSGIPTQYIIDAQGIIRASFLGYDDDAKPLDTAITQALAGGK